jgi:hypothetical protein
VNCLWLIYSIRATRHSVLLILPFKLARSTKKKEKSKKTKHWDVKNASDRWRWPSEMRGAPLEMSLCLKDPNRHRAVWSSGRSCGSLDFPERGPARGYTMDRMLTGSGVHWRAVYVHRALGTVVSVSSPPSLSLNLNFKRTCRASSGDVTEVSSCGTAGAGLASFPFLPTRVSLHLAVATHAS